MLWQQCKMRVTCTSPPTAHRPPPTWCAGGVQRHRQIDRSQADRTSVQQPRTPTPLRRKAHRRCALGRNRKIAQFNSPSTNAIIASGYDHLADPAESRRRIGSEGSEPKQLDWPAAGACRCLGHTDARRIGEVASPKTGGKQRFCNRKFVVFVTVVDYC